MLIKAGVDISRLRPEIRKRLTGLATLFWQHDIQELVITSTYEGTHSAGSLHYANLAVDIRQVIKNQLLYVEISQWLGEDYDVVQKSDHIHIEYDPK